MEEPSFIHVVVWFFLGYIKVLPPMAKPLEYMVTVNSLTRGHERMIQQSVNCTIQKVVAGDF